MSQILKKTTIPIETGIVSIIHDTTRILYPEYRNARKYLQVFHDILC